MPFVMNASNTEHQVRVHGSWFTFAPKAQKEMNADKVFFLVSNCSHLGFVGLPEKFGDLEYRGTKEGKEALARAEAEGIQNRVKHLEQLKHNELVSLQRDIDQAGLKYDARSHMSDQMIKQMEELAAYKVKKQDEAAQKIQRIKDIEKALEE